MLSSTIVTTRLAALTDEGRLLVLESVGMSWQDLVVAEAVVGVAAGF